MSRSLATIAAAALLIGGSASAQTTKTAAAPAAATSAAPASELVGLLTKELGLTPKQSEGAAGAVFGYAKTKMKPEEYAKVQKAVPEADSLAKAAPAAEPAKDQGTAGLLAGAASQLGGSAGAAAALAPAFQKLGIPPETTTKIVPLVVGYVTKKGGTSTGDILSGVLK